LVLHLISHLSIMVLSQLTARGNPNVWSTDTKNTRFLQSTSSGNGVTNERKWQRERVGSARKYETAKTSGNRDHDWIFVLISDWLRTQYLRLWLARLSRSNHLREKCSNGKKNTEEAIMKRFIEGVRATSLFLTTSYTKYNEFLPTFSVHHYSQCLENLQVFRRAPPLLVVYPAQEMKSYCTGPFSKFIPRHTCHL